MRLGITVLNSGATHILSFCARVIPHTLGEAILHSGVQWALNLRPICKNETMADCAQSLNFYASTRLNRDPRFFQLSPVQLPLYFGARTQACGALFDCLLG